MKFLSRETTQLFCFTGTRSDSEAYFDDPTTKQIHAVELPRRGKPKAFNWGSPREICASNSEAHFTGAKPTKQIYPVELPLRGKPKAFNWGQTDQTD